MTHRLPALLAPLRLALDGLLDDVVRGTDPVHGNAAYGRLVLDQLSAWRRARGPATEAA